jgi:hypothetical protein
MKIADAALIMQDKLTTEIKSIISSEGHVKTGFMLRTTEIKFLSHTYDGKIKFIFSVKAPSYFRNVEEMRIEMGKEPMLKMLKASLAYKESIMIFKDAIIDELGKGIIEQLKSKKDFKNII